MKKPKCHFCFNDEMPIMVDLGYTPSANAFLLSSGAAEQALPLTVHICNKCWLAQLSERQPSTDMFTSNYPYLSSQSPANVAHAKEYVDMIYRRLGLGKDSHVIEIGSNDGYMLQWFKKLGVPCVGFEPVKDIAAHAIMNGIDTLIQFFNEDTVGMTKQADLICGINVLAHQPHVISFVQAMSKALKPDGVITMEFPHLMNLIDKNQFDTIYHEHYYYFSLKSIKNIFSLASLVIFDVEELPEHGGSLRIYAQHIMTGRHDTTNRVRSLLMTEENKGMFSEGYYKDFRVRVRKLRRNIRDTLMGLNKTGAIYKQDYPVVAYGAAAKANTLFNSCGITKDIVRYIVDRSPYKQGLYLPQSHIPVVSEDNLRETHPSFVLITAWNLKEEIMEQLDYIRDWGGHFIIPIPELEVS